jgi:hypothetical protein
VGVDRGIPEVLLRLKVYQKTKNEYVVYDNPMDLVLIVPPTKHGKEKSESDEHCQCEKEKDDHLLACQQIHEREPHSDTLC